MFEVFKDHRSIGEVFATEKEAEDYASERNMSSDRSTFTVKPVS